MSSLGGLLLAAAGRFPRGARLNLRRRLVPFYLGSTPGNAPGTTDTTVGRLFARRDNWRQQRSVPVWFDQDLGSEPIKAVHPASQPVKTSTLGFD